MGAVVEVEGGEVGGTVDWDVVGGIDVELPAGKEDDTDRLGDVLDEALGVLGLVVDRDKEEAEVPPPPFPAPEVAAELAAWLREDRTSDSLAGAIVDSLKIRFGQGRRTVNPVPCCCRTDAAQAVCLASLLDSPVVAARWRDRRRRHCLLVVAHS